MTIKQKQNLLQYLGYYKGIPDDEWGPLSQAALEAFQRRHTLNVDGQWGPVTEKRVLEAVYNGEFAPEPGEDQLQEPAQTPSQNQEQGPDGGPAWWHDIKYFRRNEPGIACRCGKCGGFPAEPSEKLMRMVDNARGHFGAPGLPSSTVRCPTHNKKVGGVANSRHLGGDAMDVSYQGISPLVVDAYFDTVPECAYHYPIRENGILTGYVHVDVVR